MDRRKNVSRRNVLMGGTTLAAASALSATGPVQTAQAQQRAQAQQTSAQSGRKPNILFIMGDDIGWFNVSAYNLGVMGYRTPNIDRIGREGAVFTDWYGQQSCTAGRAAFITGQSPIRTGLTKVGLPGAELGLGPLDPSVADVLKTFGYATGQFGRTTWATATSICRRRTASTSSSAISITSTPRRSRKTPTTRRTRGSASASGRAVCSSRPPTARSRTPAR